MANEQNIIPHQFKPGQSGNPSGRPKGSISIVNEVRKVLEQEMEMVDGMGNKQKRKIAHVLALKMVKRAVEQDSENMMEVITNYIDGKPIQLNLMANTELDEEGNSAVVKALRKVYGGAVRKKPAAKKSK